MIVIGVFMKTKKVALVLGGGGALGFAHIGVIDILQKNNVPIDCIVGTSMGAVVGAGFAAGKSVQELTELSTSMKMSKMYDFNVNLKGLLSGSRITKFLKPVYKYENIEDLPITFVCNAVDLLTCTTHVFKSGNLITAVRSSMSVPAVFAPVKYQGMTLVDGGILDNMACDIAKNMGYDVIIAVDVISKSVFDENVNSLFGSVTQSLLIMQQQIQNLQTPNEPCDVIITPDLKDHKQYVFHKESTEDIIEKGRLATIDAMPQILKVLSKNGIKIKQTKKHE